MQQFWISAGVLMLSYASNQISARYAVACDQSGSTDLLRSCCLAYPPYPVSHPLPLPLHQVLRCKGGVTLSSHQLPSFSSSTIIHTHHAGSQVLAYGYAAG